MQQQITLVTPTRLVGALTEWEQDHRNGKTLSHEQTRQQTPEEVGAASAEYLAAKLPALPAFGALIAGQGGHFAAIMRGPIVDGVEQPPYALLVSPAASGELQDVQWGSYGKDVPGCQDRRDGTANTTAMVAAECPAALCVRNLAIDGHTDWYLPAIGELNAAAANVPELFEPDGWYWSSTQLSRYDAFAQGFATGDSYWDVKDSEFRVRAFRRIPLDALTA